MISESLKLFDYQKLAVPFHLRRPYSFNAFEMGLGKSVVSLAVAEAAGAKKILVICPAFLKHNWTQEVKKFTDRTVKGTVEDKGKWGVQIVSYEQMQKIGDFGIHDFIITDEAHYLKNPKAQRTKKFHELMEAHKPARYMALSGTPVKNRVIEFWSLLRLMWLGGQYESFNRYANSYYSFCQDFTNAKRFKISGRQITKYEGMKNPDKLLELIKPIYTRRKAKDVLDLPEQVRDEVLQNDRSRFDSELDRAWNSYESNAESRTFSSAKAVNALAKVPFTRDFVDNLLLNTDRVVIFTDHVQSAVKLYTEFGARSRFVCGDTPVAKRGIYVDDFEAGSFPVLIATIGSLSMGINLTSCNYMVFNDFPWVPADMDQAEKRIHRIGQDETCFYYYMLNSKVDQRILRSLNKKRNLVDILTENNK